MAQVRTGCRSAEYRPRPARRSRRATRRRELTENESDGEVRSLRRQGGVPAEPEQQARPGPDNRGDYHFASMSTRLLRLLAPTRPTSVFKVATSESATLPAVAVLP